MKNICSLKGSSVQEFFRKIEIAGESMTGGTGVLNTGQGCPVVGSWVATVPCMNSDDY